MRAYHYRRSTGGGFSPLIRLSPAVKLLLITNVIAFLVGSMVGRPFIYFFGLVPESVLSRLYVWQLFTYLFLHGGFLHLFFNMFALWMFGSELENSWGTNFFLKFYFLTGAGAGVITVFLSKMPTVPTIGASGAVFAILMAFALTFPNRLYIPLFPFSDQGEVPYDDLLRHRVYRQFEPRERWDRSCHGTLVGCSSPFST